MFSNRNKKGELGVFFKGDILLQQFTFVKLMSDVGFVFVTY